jgi:pimeloyl-ACP methyl ester carboxylesterase
VTSSARSFGSVELNRHFDQLKIPLLLVYGDKDPFISPMQVDELRDLDENVRPMELNDSGHFPMMDEANKFQRLLRDFLETKPADLGELTLKEEWRRRMH